MPAETILMLDDEAHCWNSAVSIYGQSSIATGYYPEAVRDTSYLGGWRPVDGTADEYIQIDGGSAGWLGTTGGDLIYVAIAYDTRNSDQTSVALLQDTADNPTGFFLTIRITFPLTAGIVGCTYDTFALTASGKRYYRIVQPNGNRGGGTKPATILAWAMFKPSGVVKIENYQAGNISPANSDLLDNVGKLQAPSGFNHVQAKGRSGHAFELKIRRARKLLWQDIVKGMYFAGAGARAFFVQYEGLKNDGLADFQMARVANDRWSSMRPYVDEFETGIPMVTEPHP